MSSQTKVLPLPSITVCSEQAAQTAQAQALAESLNLGLAELDQSQNQLVVTERHIGLRMPGLGNPIWIDFLSGKNAHRRQYGGGKGQTLAKALSLRNNKNPHIIDATAGFGRDAFVMATLGCQVTMIERNAIIACLLRDALERGLADEKNAPLFQTMQLVNADAVAFLQTQLSKPVDIIYLDPMYPSRNKAALVKKEMQLLHQLVGPDLDSEQLLNIARDVARKRVVVKRPKSADPINNSKPSTCIASKNTRYDIYLC
jgi:16S rRNA (guanine1516-N2)-methyltransferase